MIKRFIDTSYLIAVEISDDEFHEAAFDHWGNLSKSPSNSFVTTSYILTEVVTFLNNRGLHSKAVALGNNLLRSRTVNLIHVDEELFYEGWSYFQKRKDKHYSLTDCISFVVMKGLEITEALTFDKHFAQAGFVKLP